MGNPAEPTDEEQPTAAASTTKQIHICTPGGQQSIYREDQIRALWQRGLLADSVLYWQEGMTDWHPLNEYFAPAPSLMGAAQHSTASSTPDEVTPPRGEAPPVSSFDQTFSPSQENQITSGSQRKQLTATEKIDRDIRWAWIPAVFSAAVLLVAVPIVVLMEKPLGYSGFGSSAWDLINVPILLGLGFGVYKRSRVCSVLLTIFAVLAVLGRIMEPKPGPWAVASIFYLFVICRGTLAVFRYHKLQTSVGLASLEQYRQTEQSARQLPSSETRPPLSPTVANRVSVPRVSAPIIIYGACAMLAIIFWLLWFAAGMGMLGIVFLPLTSTPYILWVVHKEGQEPERYFKETYADSALFMWVVRAFMLIVISALISLVLFLVFLVVFIIFGAFFGSLR